MALSGCVHHMVYLCTRSCSSASTPIHLLTSRLGNITTIALNRPEKRNCVSTETSRHLTAALLAFEADESSPVAVLYGKGGNFCSGCDLNELVRGDTDINDDKCDETGGSDLRGDDSDDAIIERQEYKGMVWRRPCQKPVVAAVDGYAVGGGLELALWCDLRVIEETAVLGAYGRRFGIPLQSGGTARLQALVGLSRALDLIVTGRGLTGTEAAQWGLAARLVACGTALGQAVSLASSIAKFPTAAIAADRRATYFATTEAKSLQAALRYEIENAEACMPEARENAVRFLRDGVGRHGKFRLHPEKIAEWSQP